jgi:hypothetical protein
MVRLATTQRGKIVLSSSRALEKGVCEIQLQFKHRGANFVGEMYKNPPCADLHPIPAEQTLARRPTSFTSTIMRLLSLAFVALLTGLIAASPAYDVALREVQCCPGPCSREAGRDIHGNACPPGCCRARSVSRLHHGSTWSDHG